MRLFLREAKWDNDSLFLGREIKKRLVRVMRMRPGDRFELAVPQQRWECELEAILPDGVVIKKRAELPSQTQNRLRLILGQAIPKGDRFGWLIQKATELGISEIYPLITVRTIVRPENTEIKLQRWNEIAAHAAEQSESDTPCVVWPPETLEIFLKRRFPGLKLLLHEREGAAPLKEILSEDSRGGLYARPPVQPHDNASGYSPAANRSYTQSTYDNNTIIIIVGPEGGWAPQETKALEEAEFHKVHMGLRIMRSETAGLALAAIIQYERGDFSGKS